MADDDDARQDDPDLRLDDLEYDPEANPPKSARAWLNRLEESRNAFARYHDHCVKIERRYADLMRLADNTRDKEFQMFWANMEVLKPSIYARPPKPVVAPKFKDRRPVPNAASEFLERCCVVAFDLTRMHDLLMLVRDDLAMLDRGVAWCRYESAKANKKGAYGGEERFCVDFKRRFDFLHSLSQNWREVTWVAAASYLTRGEARKRFRKYSGDEYQSAEYKVDRDSKEQGGADGRERAKFWEIWDKPSNRVIWVAEGCEKILDEDDPHLKLQNFFPCPKPAYGTVQPGSLVPVPSVLQYEDQLIELNTLTARIHALSECLEAKGFYPSGTSEIADAVQAAVAYKTPGRLLVPISNWAAFGGSKEIIVWLPIDMIAQVITECVGLRKQVISDIYEIVGLSDIMRGSTDPQETLGAQQLKVQSGSARVRDKQGEMVRLARDVVEIAADVMMDKFDPVTLIEMSQTDLLTNKMTEEQMVEKRKMIAQLNQLSQVAQTDEGKEIIATNPQAQELAERGPQMLQQAKADLAKLQRAPTLDQVLEFLDDKRLRAFVLDIETDSTIQLDEQAEKQGRSEFMGMLSQLLPQLSAMMTAEPETADFCGEMLKFAVAPFRAGRALDGSIDALVEKMKDKASQPQQPPPELQIEQMKDQTAKEKIKSDADLRTAELKQKDEHKKADIEKDKEIEAMRLRAKQGDKDAEVQKTNLEAIHSREEHQQKMVEGDQKIRQGQQQLVLKQQESQQRRADMAAAAADRRAQNQFKMTQAAMKPAGGPVR